MSGGAARAPSRLAGVLAVAAIAPTLVPYADVQERFASGGQLAQTIEFSAVATQWLPAPPTSAPAAADGRLLGALLGPGLAMLAAVGVWRGAPMRDDGRRLAAVYLSVAAIMSAGRPHPALGYADADACVLRVLDAPPRLARAPERRVPLDGARLATSSGDDPAAAVDGDLATDWTQPVDAGRDGWLEIDLLEPRPVTRVVLRLGRDFGEHLRAYAVAVSEDGVVWRTVVSAPVAPTPLAAFVTDPNDVTTEIELPGTPVAHLRVVRTPARPEDTVLFLDWDRWGVHELEVYERAP